MDLSGFLRDAYGWDGEVTVSPGPRGAMGRIWRVEAAGRSFALKEAFFEPPSEAHVAAQLMLARQAAARAVRTPALFASRDGRHLLRGPDGAWLRLYEWLEVVPVDLTASGVPDQVGALLARLHRDAPPARDEIDGQPPDPWYDRVPTAAAFAPALSSDAAWVPRLAAHLASLPSLCAAVAPVDPSRLVLSHRDLHPGNVLVDAGGTLVVLDWDNLGPADPARELAAALFDWWCEPDPDEPAMREMYAAYVASGGPARVSEPADFTMLLAARLNFLRVQLDVLLDETSAPEHRGWAEQEVDESLRILPPPGQLARVLDLARSLNGDH